MLISGLLCTSWMGNHGELKGKFTTLQSQEARTFHGSCLHPEATQNIPVTIILIL